MTRYRLLLALAIIVPVVLAAAVNTARAADNGWLRGSCESGSGTYRWTDGNRYEGQCSNNYFQGQGTLFLNNGDRYEGQFANDQKNGTGTYFFTNGVSSTFLNSTSVPSACSAICPFVAVLLLP